LAVEEERPFKYMFFLNKCSLPEGNLCWLPRRDLLHVMYVLSAVQARD